MALRRLAALLMLLLTGVAMALALALPAAAHVDLESASPAAGDRLAQAPTEVRLTFTEPLDATLVTVSVTAPSGAELAAGPATGSGATISQPLSPTTEAGRVTVAYRVVGQDGHPITGRYRFTLRVELSAANPTESVASADSEPEPETPGAPEPDTAGGGSITGPALLGVAALGAIGGGAVLAARRRDAAGKSADAP